MIIPRTPFSSHLSGSAKETELRLQNIFQWKKKRPSVVLVVLTVVLVLFCFGLVSCKNDSDEVAVDKPIAEASPPIEEENAPDTSSSSPSENAKTEREMAMEAFSAILSGRGEFVSAESGAVLTIARIKEEVPAVEGATVTVPTFAFVDMDGDSVEELVLTLMVDESNQYGSEILHYHEGTVYGYTVWVMGMHDLKVDGTYSVSYSGVWYGTCTMEFGESGRNTKILAETRFWGRNENVDTKYSVNGEPATSEEVDEVYRQQRRKEDVRWYDLTCGWGGDLNVQPYVFMVENNISAERRVYEEWSPLTKGQKDLLAYIPASKLPKEAVKWGGTVARKNIWEDTLVPLVYNEENDVTLYGVVGAEELWGRTMILNQELGSDGLVLRVGGRAAYFPFGWGGNHWYGGAPLLEILDTDGDGQGDTAAVAPWDGRGVGVHAEVLYLIDLNDLTYQVVDFSQMNIQVWCDPAAKTATLTCGDSSVTVDTSAKENVTRCTAMGQVHFSAEEGQIHCSVGLDFGGAVCYWAWANGVIRFTDVGPCFADIVMSDTAAVQNG